ncbi:MAG: potassium channel family protein [Betaproteobacteria bacterium]
MRVVSLVAGLLVAATVLWDAFETIVLPRTVSRRFRLARVFFRGTWWPWAYISRAFGSDGRRERFLAIYGPVSLIGLLTVWAVGLVLSFAALHWAAGSMLQGSTPGPAAFADDVYMSGTTFFTLGLGDLRPIGATARLLTVVESGMGLGLLALVIAYFPVLYQSFSRREVRLTLLDSWAGSPPAAAEVLRRLAEAGELNALERFLTDWEYWCSDLLESHISYPLLAFFRSQHQRQSWVAALTTILDLSALVSVGIDDGVSAWQAHVTFAIARHAAVDLTQVLHAVPDDGVDRLTADGLEQLRRQLELAGLHPRRSADADARFIELRRSYEPFVAGLGRLLVMPLPAWSRAHSLRDNWQTSSHRDGGPHL